MPSDVELADAAVIASRSLTLNDRVTLSQTAVSDRLGLTVGHDAKTGSLRGGRMIFLKDRATVTGDATAGLAVSSGQHGVSVTGSIEQNVPVTLRNVGWQAQAPGASLGPVTLNAEENRLLAPGAYGPLTVQSRAKLTLQTGVYVFQSALLEAQSELIIADSNGPVQVFVNGSFTYRGKVVSTDQSVPKLVIGYLGTAGAMVEAPFTGAFIAPNADVRFQAARPDGHRAFIYGKTVTLDADTIIKPYPVPWFELVGRSEYTPPAPDSPTIDLPPSSTSIQVTPTGTGDTTETEEVTDPVNFNLPPLYPVSSGSAGNAIVTFTFQSGSGPSVTCSYQGGSSTATPTTQAELNKGRTLHFVSCSDGLPLTTRRTGTRFTVTAPAVPGYPYSITPPMTKDGGCGEKLELLTPSQVDSMRSSFSWSQQTKVPAVDLQGRPTLYYAWIYVANEDDLLALRKLKIHVLNRPLFVSEYAEFDDRCGTFTNPGDGTGTFLPALIAGAGYNQLIDALNAPDIEGDREIFQAVILRDPPDDARTPQGSVDIDKLAKSGFRYLSYEPNPFQDFSEIQLDMGFTKFITDALTWVATAFDDAGQWFAAAFADLDKEIRGYQNVRFHVHALTKDPDFGGRGGTGSVAVRGWGPLAGLPLAATGMEVGVLQWFLNSPIPVDTHAHTNAVGAAVLDIVRGGGLRTEGNGSGVCIQHETDAAMIVDFLTPSSQCDFRTWNPDAGVLGEAAFTIRTLSAKPDNVLIVDSPRLNTLYQSDDVYTYSKDVLQFRPKRARILSGSFASTFSQDLGGVKRPYAPCLNHANTFSDVGALATAATTTAIAAGTLGQVPGFGQIATALVAAASTAFASVIFNTDIVMPEDSSIRTSRNVGSHEYGHYIFCSMLNEVEPEAVGYLVKSTVFGAGGEDQRRPVRWINEAMADWFTGQVVSGANYGWADALTGAGGFTDERYCAPPVSPVPPGTPWCWDGNLNEVTTDFFGSQSIGRAATLLHDVFDGAGATRASGAFSDLLPNDADAWRWSNPSDTNLPLVLSSTGYNNTDSSFDRVAIPGAAGMAAFTRLMATGLRGVVIAFDGPLENDFSEEKFYSSIAGAMEESNVNWCDRCRVLALHTPGIVDPMAMPIRDVFEACLNTPLTAGALGAPPAAPSKLKADDCSICGPGTVADASGSCVPECPADVVVDAGTLAEGTTHVFNTGTSAPADTCPETFVLRMENHGALFGDPESTKVSLGPTPVSATSCPGIYEMTSVLTKAGIMTSTTLLGTGVWTPCSGALCTGDTCMGLPEFLARAPDADVAEYQTATNTAGEMTIEIPTIIQ